MKCLILSYLIALMLFGGIINYKTTDKNNQNLSDDSIKKNLNCKICQEMFEVEFNYEKLLKDDTKLNQIKTELINFWQSQGQKLSDINPKKYFFKENLESISKEISMEYFFKGEESQFSNEENNMEKFKNCKNTKVGNDKICDELKLRLCENILSYENGVCLNLRKKRNMQKDNSQSINEIKPEGSDNSAINKNKENKNLKQSSFLKNRNIVKQRNENLDLSMGPLSPSKLNIILNLIVYI